MRVIQSIMNVTSQHLNHINCDEPDVWYPLSYASGGASKTADAEIRLVEP